MKGKTKLKFYKNKSNYFKEMKNRNFQTRQYPFSKNAQGISKIYHEVLLLMNFLQTKPQVKNMNIKYYDLSYTVNKNRKEKNNEEQKEIVYDKYENNENDYFSLNDVIIPNHYVGIKGREK